MAMEHKMATPDNSRKMTADEALALTMQNLRSTQPSAKVLKTIDEIEHEIEERRSAAHTSRRRKPAGFRRPQDEG